MPSIRVVDLFCSAGGLTLGVAEASASLFHGTRVLLAVDTDAKALGVYNRNIRPLSVSSQSVATLARYGVVSDGKAMRIAGIPEIQPPLLEAVGQVDLLIGGPPCQGHSGLNNATRRTDPRNSLYLAAVATAIGLGARAVLLENVPEIRRSSIDVVTSARRSLDAAGYETDEAVLCASDLGWPQSRKRHFLIASKSGLSPLARVAQAFVEEPPGAADFLRSLPKRSPFLESIPEYNGATRDRLRYFEENPDQFDLPLSERPTCHSEGTTYRSVYGRMRPDEPVPTLTTGFLTPGRGRFVHPFEKRTLTPGEAAFVQGFPAWFDFDSDGVTRQDLTKWIGDAVPLPLGYIAAMSILPGLVE
jgi:DNA (cytosine-5)-methyltransferase 1